MSPDLIRDAIILYGSALVLVALVLGAAAVHDLWNDWKRRR